MISFSVASPPSSSGGPSALQGREEPEHGGEGEDQILRVCAEELREAAPELAVGGRFVLTIRDAGPGPQQVGEGVVAQLRADREGAPLQPGRLLDRVALAKLLQQAGLSDPGFPHHRDHAARPRFEPGHRAAEPLHLPIATHQRRAHPLVRATHVAVEVLTTRDDLVHLHLPALPLEGEGVEGPELEGVPGVSVCLFADPDLPLRRQVLETSGDVDGVAHHRELADHRPADVAGDHLAGVDSGVDVERLDQALLAVELVDAVVHLDGGVDGGLGRLLHRQRNAEHGHDAVAQVLVDGAPVLSGDAVEQLQAGGDDRIGILDVEALVQPGEAGDVREEDGRPSAFRLAGSLIRIHLASPRRPRSAGGPCAPRADRLSGLLADARGALYRVIDATRTGHPARSRAPPGAPESPQTGG